MYMCVYVCMYVCVYVCMWYKQSAVGAQCSDYKYVPDIVDLSADSTGFIFQHTPTDTDKAASSAVADRKVINATVQNIIRF